MSKDRCAKRLYAGLIMFLSTLGSMHYAFASAPLLTNEMSAALLPEKPDWSHPTIWSIPATNPLPNAPMSPEHPAVASLSALETIFESERLPMDLYRPRITSIQRSGLQNEENVIAQLEYLRVTDVLKVADSLAYGGDREGAIKVLEDALPQFEQDKALHALYHRLGAYAFRIQDYEKAAKYMQVASELSPTDASLACNLAAVLIMQNRLDEALKALKNIRPELLDSPKLRFSVYFNLACVYSMRGENDDALSSLAAAAREDAPSTLASIGDPQLDGIRDDFRFQTLLDGLEEYIDRDSFFSENSRLSY